MEFEVDVAGEAARRAGFLVRSGGSVTKDLGQGGRRQPDVHQDFDAPAGGVAGTAPAGRRGLGVA